MREFLAVFLLRCDSLCWSCLPWRFSNIAIFPGRFLKFLAGGSCGVAKRFCGLD